MFHSFNDMKNSVPLDLTDRTLQSKWLARQGRDINARAERTPLEKKHCAQGASIKSAGKHHTGISRSIGHKHDATNEIADDVGTRTSNFPTVHFVSGHRV